MLVAITATSTTAMIGTTAAGSAVVSAAGSPPQATAA